MQQLNFVTMETLGEKILQALSDKGLKQSWLADKLGWDRQRVNQLKLRKTFDLEFLQKLNELTGIDFTAEATKAELPNFDPNLINDPAQGYGYITVAFNVAGVFENMQEALPDFMRVMRREAQLRGLIIK